jgi:hypothetical protein
MSAPIFSSVVYLVIIVPPQQSANVGAGVLHRAPFARGEQLGDVAPLAARTVQDADVFAAIPDDRFHAGGIERARPRRGTRYAACESPDGACVRAQPALQMG